MTHHKAGVGQKNLENLDNNVLPTQDTALTALVYRICQHTVQLTAGHIEPAASVSTVPKVIGVV